jgi:hypothetical protein
MSVDHLTDFDKKSVMYCEDPQISDFRYFLNEGIDTPAKFSLTKVGHQAVKL